MFYRDCKASPNAVKICQFFEGASFTSFGSLAVGDMKESQLFILFTRYRSSNAGIHPAGDQTDSKATRLYFIERRAALLQSLFIKSAHQTPRASAPQICLCICNCI